MRISCNWLRDYIECDLSAEQIAEALTSIGLEVDSLEQVEAIPGGLAGVIVAEVVECYDHPDSDHLHITRLNTGEPEPETVVLSADADYAAVARKIRRKKTASVLLSAAGVLAMMAGTAYLSHLLFPRDNK